MLALGRGYGRKYILQQGNKTTYGMYGIGLEKSYPYNEPPTTVIKRRTDNTMTKRQNDKQ
jgi:hypothetical protein